MSSIVSEQCNFIVIGAWNPAIIQANWLRNEFPDLIPEKFNIQLVQGVRPFIRIELEDLIIDPNGGQLVFIPKEVNDRTIEYTSTLSLGIYEKLKHTPIVAAGCNFVFKLDKNETFYLDKYEYKDGIKVLYENILPLTLISSDTKHVFSRNTHKITIDYNCTGDERTLLFNYEYQSPQTAMKEAAEALIDNFHHAQELSRGLIKK